jgi:hypothetical protein
LIPSILERSGCRVRNRAGSKRDGGGDGQRAAAVVERMNIDA